jgi:mRNA interferase RelE/StbE
LYEIQFKTNAGKELAKLPRKEQVEIATILESLKENPKPLGHKQLSGFDEHRPIFRVWCACGKHRIIYTIKENFLLILVLKVGLRATVYSEFAEMMRNVRPPPIMADTLRRELLKKDKKR